MRYTRPRLDLIVTYAILSTMRGIFPTIDVKKYGGRQVAVFNGKVIAVGDTLAEVIRKARKRAPKKPLNEIHIFAVPKTLTVIYYG